MLRHPFAAAAHQLQQQQALESANVVAVALYHLLQHGVTHLPRYQQQHQPLQLQRVLSGGRHAKPALQQHHHLAEIPNSSSSRQLQAIVPILKQEVVVVLQLQVEAQQSTDA